MEKIANCSRDRDRCSLCVQLAKDEFGDELLRGGFDEGIAKNYTGDSKLSALVEDVSGVDALSCEDRRNRARIIGRKAGEDLVYRSRSPGDI